jgi:hypothetical protein
MVGRLGGLSLAGLEPISPTTALEKFSTPRTPRSLLLQTPGHQTSYRTSTCSNSIACHQMTLDQGERTHSCALKSATFNDIQSLRAYRQRSVTPSVRPAHFEVRTTQNELITRSRSINQDLRPAEVGTGTPDSGSLFDVCASRSKVLHKCRP